MSNVHTPSDGQSWGGIYDELHRSPPPNCPDLIYVGEAKLGCIDQEDLYPHLLTEADGVRVVVPLGDCGEGFNDDYQVAPFRYQPLPQKEIHWVWWFPIVRVRLFRRLKDERQVNEGMIRVVANGRMELSCINQRGMVQWLPIPDRTTRKPVGAIYQKWEIVVQVPSDATQGNKSEPIVRFSGGRFHHWPLS